MRTSFLHNRILVAILLPVVCIGVAYWLLASRVFTKPLIALLKNRTEANLRYATDMGINVCDERFADLMDLRLEDDPEMNDASRQEAIQEIKSISKRFPHVRMLVVENNAELIGSTSDIESGRLNLPPLKKAPSGIESFVLSGEPVRYHSQYFPFWRWNIIGYIAEKDYMAPIAMAERIINFGTIGTLIVLFFTVLTLFIWRINNPLRRIVDATKDVAEGRFNGIDVRWNDEIGKVALAFNAMVGSIEEDQRKIKSFMSELRDSEEQYRLLTESSLTYIAMIQKSRFIYANKRLLETLGYTQDRFIGLDVMCIIDPEDRRMVVRKIAALESGERDVDHFDCRCRSTDGRVWWFEVLATLILYRERHAVLVHAIDITLRKKAEVERRLLEERLARAQKMEAIGELAGAVAHDLNNILGGLVSYPEVLLLEIPEDSPLRDPLITIRESGRKAAAIVQDMLTLARRGVPTKEVMNLNEIIDDYLNSPEHMKLQRSHPNIRFMTEQATDACNVKGSPFHLSKAVMNLAANAAEAMPDGGTVTISTENRYVDSPIYGYEVIEEGDYVVLGVEDTGIGIALDDLGKVFDPFYTKKVMGKSGTGLGMTVVWGAVKDHNGFIDVITRPGEGARIELYFPLTREEVSEQESIVSLDSIGGTESILVVDDVEEQRRIAAQMLEGMGYSVETAANGEEAVRIIEKSPVDLLILDMIMDPGIDGLETYRRVLEIRPDQKAIITSGFSESERVRETQKLGAGSYVKKPFIMETLGVAVRMELDRER